MDIKTTDLITALSLIHLIGELNKIFDGNFMNWAWKYDRIFSPNGSQRVAEYCRELRINLDYCDPDTTYEEDVRAYMEALNELQKELKETLEKPLTYEP